MKISCDTRESMSLDVASFDHVPSGCIILYDGLPDDFPASTIMIVLLSFIQNIAPVFMSSFEIGDVSSFEIGNLTCAELHGSVAVDATGTIGWEPAALAIS